MIEKPCYKIQKKEVQAFVMLPDKAFVMLPDTPS